MEIKTNLPPDFRQEYKTAGPDINETCGWCKKSVEFGQVYLESSHCVNPSDRIWHKRCVDIHDGSLQGEKPSEALLSGHGRDHDRLMEEDYQELHRNEPKEEKKLWV